MMKAFSEGTAIDEKGNNYCYCCYISCWNWCFGTVYHGISADKNNVLDFSGYNGYMEIEFLLNDANPDDSMKLDISCALKGNGFNSFNRIHGINHEIML